MRFVWAAEEPNWTVRRISASHPADKLVLGFPKRHRTARVIVASPEPSQSRRVPLGFVRPRRPPTRASVRVRYSRSKAAQRKNAAYVNWEKASRTGRRDTGAVVRGLAGRSAGWWGRGAIQLTLPRSDGTEGNKQRPADLTRPHCLRPAWRAVLINFQSNAPTSASRDGGLENENRARPKRRRFRGITHG